jgi:pyridoxine kinase
VNILSIQSWVAYGHVGNASAAFPLQRLGAEVWAVNTVQFSNHTGYGDWTGEVYSGAQVAHVIAGIEARGAFAICDAVLSGYMGDQGIGATILDTVARVKTANPAALYCCDPVIGDDDTGDYVRPGIAELLRDQALPAADIITPNRFEVQRLTGQDCATLAGAKAAIAQLQAMMAPTGPRCVLLTSLRSNETPDDAIDMLAAEAGAIHLLRTPLESLAINGAGDAIAALFLFHRLNTGSAKQALEQAGSAIHGLLARTAAAGSREILTVAAQEEFVNPSRHFQASLC